MIHFMIRNQRTSGKLPTTLNPVCGGEPGDQCSYDILTLNHFCLETLVLKLFGEYFGLFLCPESSKQKFGFVVCSRVWYGVCKVCFPL